MVHKLTIVVFMVAVGASCLAQDGLVIRTLVRAFVGGRSRVLPEMRVSDFAW
jgi:hypothetical protein